MERLNSEGLPRHDLLWALSEPAVVKSFRIKNACMLCFRKPINEASLCDICYAMLDGREFEAANAWLSGERV